MVQFLRPLESFDEVLLYNSQLVYFTMKQHAKRNVSGNYELEFNCRRFEDRIDQEQHRCKDNWSYFPIKNLPSDGSKISMEIKSKKFY